MIYASVKGDVVVVVVAISTTSVTAVRRRIS